MSNSKKAKETEFEKRFKEIIQNETKYGIIITIRNFGSMNIKNLSRIMGKTESTIFHHISEMLKDPEILEIDNVKTKTTRGIYYKLSNRTNKIYPKEPDSIYEETLPTIFERAASLNNDEISRMMVLRMISQPDLGQMANKARRTMSYYHNIENFILNSFERVENALLEGYKPKNLDYIFGSHSLLSLDMKISKPKHIMEIAVIIAEFFANLTKYKKKLENEMKNEGVNEEDRINVQYYLFGGEVADFEFDKNEYFDYKKYAEPIVEKMKKIYEGIEE